MDGKIQSMDGKSSDSLTVELLEEILKNHFTFLMKTFSSLFQGGSKRFQNQYITARPEDYDDILDYADAIVQPRGIGYQPKMHTSYQPKMHTSSIAASLMIGLKVLALNYADGLYYLGKIVDVVNPFNTSSYLYIYNFIVSVCKQKSVCPPVTQKLSVVWRI